MQDKIPNEVDVNNPEQLEQVRKFFITSLDARLAMDLIPDNLRVKENGIVVLIDFVEDDSDGFFIFINKAVVMWAILFAEKNGKNRNKTEEFLNQLTEKFSRYGYTQDIKMVLDEACFSVNSYLI